MDRAYPVPGLAQEGAPPPAAEALRCHGVSLVASPRLKRLPRSRRAFTPFEYVDIDLPSLETLDQTVFTTFAPLL